MSRKKFWFACILVLTGLCLLAAANSKAEDLVFGGVVKAPGGNQSYWLTSFSVVNGSNSVANYEIRDVLSKKLLFQFDLSPQSVAATTDVVGLMGLPEDAYAIKLVMPDNLKGTVLFKTYNSGSIGTPGVALTPLTPLTDGSKYILFDKTGDFRNKLYVLVQGTIKFKVEYFDISSNKIGELVDNSAVEKFAYFNPPANASYCKLTITEIVVGCPSPCSESPSQLYAYVTAVDNLIGTPVVIQ